MFAGNSTVTTAVSHGQCPSGRTNRAMKLSRHAKNNMRLYKITEQDIIESIESPDSTEREGDKLIALKGFLHKYSHYPLKVVYKKTKDEMTIITVYPLKRKFEGGRA